MLMGFFVGIIALLIVAFVACFFVFAWFRVEEGHAAVLTAFGAPRLSPEGRPVTFPPGLHSKRPWERVHEFSVMERAMKIGEENRALEVLARDGTVLRVDGRARFRFRTELAEFFLFGVRDPLLHLKETFRGVLAEEMGCFGQDETKSGSYAELRKERRKLDAALSARVEDLRSRYGIEFRAVDLAEILPPSDLADALNGIQKVKAEFATLLKRVEAESARKIVAAEHGVEIARTHGEATENEIRVLGATVAELESNGSLDSYIRRRRDEATLASRSVYMKSE